MKFRTPKFYKLKSIFFTMNRNIFIACVFLFSLLGVKGYAQKLTPEIASKLAEMPMGCIEKEYPNKTAHVINNENEAKLTPRELHPSFYGCFDWHSSVHGHWMLVRLLKTMPELPNAEKIRKVLNESFKKENIIAETNYFEKYEGGKSYERTYGWAWLLKLDEELSGWDDADARQWHENMQPLTQTIVKLWKEYLPKETYPNRTGVHPNSAFAIGFAIDWAKQTNDTDFEQRLTEKAKLFYLNDEKTPAYLEPNGSDFFSPSLEIADLMRRVLPALEFATWFDGFYDERGIERICEIPHVSDITDYQIVHLVGLSLSRAWCMKHVATVLPANHPTKNLFKKTSDKLLENALPLVFGGNYGGDHWLASFAVMALEDK